MRTKLVVIPNIIAKMIDEISFFSIIVGVTSGWHYKCDDRYTCQKIVNLSSTNKIHLKCDVIDGSLVNGCRQPILYNFVLNKPSGYKVFCQPEIIHSKKTKRSVLNTLTFYLEDDNNEEFDFNQETITFTL